MKWTTKLPDRPGHWWHRYTFGDVQTGEHNVWKIRNYAGHLAVDNWRLDSQPVVPEEWSDEPIPEPSE